MNSIGEIDCQMNIDYVNFESVYICFYLAYKYREFFVETPYIKLFFNAFNYSFIK